MRTTGYSSSSGILQGSVVGLKQPQRDIVVQKIKRTTMNPLDAMGINRASKIATSMAMIESDLMYVEVLSYDLYRFT